MQHLRQTKRFIGRKLLVLEALVALLQAYLILKWLPFTRYKKGLGAHMLESPTLLGIKERQRACKVSRAVQTAARLLPFKTTCMVQAVAAKQLLRRRRLSNTLYIGLGKDEAGFKTVGHAWLRVGQDIITGGGALETYVVVGSYAEEAL